MVIDDECDNASVDTGIIVSRDENNNPIAEHMPTAINRGIRGFLNIFEKSTYVGYTATPFASVLIHRDGYLPDYGEDLFPRHFIINLPQASNYIGPERVFGIEEDPDLGIDASSGYPLYRTVEDHTAVIPDRHKKDLLIRELPDSLREAVRAFILSCAARRVRGQKSEHNSMLIHVTRFIMVQEQITELVKEEIRRLTNRLRLGNGKSSENIWKELQSLWEEDFLTGTSIRMGALGATHEWKSVRAEVIPAIEKFHVKQINGQSADILEYKNYRETGINVIAIGGNKLSRGLTLEGLTISYYLRSSRMYDTLMQMGRWFGYRDGYLDLCRIYTTYELITWYRYIALASLELRREFDYMVENDEEPEKYGLKIRSHPGALSVTAFNKMRNGTRMTVTFDGYMTQTLWIHNNKEAVKANFRAVEHLIENREFEEISEVGYKFTHIDPDGIKTFLSEYKTHIRNISYRSSHLIDYISKMNMEDELVDWTVIILSKKGGEKSKVKVKETEDYLLLTGRTAFEVNPDYVQFAKALLSPSHEKLDLTAEEEKQLSEKTGKAGRAKPKDIRACRSPQRGLLLLYPIHGCQKDNKSKIYGDSEYPCFGYVISFPNSGKDREVEYIVDSLYPDELEAA